MMMASKQRVTSTHHVWLLSSKDNHAAFGSEIGAREAADVVQSHGVNVTVEEIRYYYDSARTEDLVDTFLANV